MADYGTRWLLALPAAALLLCPERALADAIVPSSSDGEVIVAFGVMFVAVVIVVIIISLIALIAVVSFLAIRKKAHDDDEPAQKDGRPVPPRSA